MSFAAFDTIRHIVASFPIFPVVTGHAALVAGFFALCKFLPSSTVKVTGLLLLYRNKVHPADQLAPISSRNLARLQYYKIEADGVIGEKFEIAESSSKRARSTR